MTADGRYETYLTTRYFPGLDGLRLLAILPVLWHHATPRLLPGILGKGAVGVDLFFVLSGYLITTLLLREKRATGDVSLRGFYLRRALRIFPLYYGMLAAHVVGTFFSKARAASDHFLANLIYHATYTANWFVNYDVPHGVIFSFSWSLCVEEQFYLFWPALVLFSPSRRWLVFALLCLGFWDYGIEHRLIFDFLAPGETLRRIGESFSTAIGCGALLAIALDHPKTFPVLMRCLSFPFLPLVAAGGAAFALSETYTPYYPLCLSLTALVGALVVKPSGLFSRCLGHPAAALGGQLSYAAYLLHIPILSALRTLLPSLRERPGTLVLVALPFVFGVSYLAHRFVERPFLRWKAELSRRSERLPLPQGQTA